MTRKLTTHQRSIADHLAGAGAFRSAQDIHAALRQAGSSVGLATVYRGLQVLADEGLVDVVRAGDGEARYRACSPGHHHHLVCRSCGDTREIAAALVERWADEVGRGHGYRDIQHSIELFGVCQVCSGG